MPRSLQTVQKQVFRCDECKKEEHIAAGAKRTGWLTVISSESDGLRLFQKKDKVPRYESFHLPNKEEKVYCSRECVFKNLTKSVDLFIAEISPHTVLGLRRKPID